ncbi:hypothetical protein TNCV_2866571 [Trichonephila clavipes]|nr:hypothetical protein TNCV_2866571 [Trichonephila clavipes]
MLESSNTAFKVAGSIAFHHPHCYLTTLVLNTLSNLNIPFISLELIRNKREFTFPKKTPKKIIGKVPYRFVTKLRSRRPLQLLHPTVVQYHALLLWHQTNLTFRLTNSYKNVFSIKGFSN